MRSLLLLTIGLLACGDDGTSRDSHQLATCDSAANYQINMQPVTECELGCQVRPTNSSTCAVGAGKPQCFFGTITFDGVDGCCAASSAQRVLFVECE